MGLKKLTISGEEHGKGSFSDTLSSIITNHRAGAKLIGRPAQFVLEACRLTDKWTGVAHRSCTEVRISNKQVGPRRVKMIVLRTVSEKDGKTHDIMVPKQQLVDALFPAKKRESTDTPENKHYKQVRGAMRNAVSYQLKKARENIDWGFAECCNTGHLLRKGMKIDIDHWGTCFAELCDQWLAFEGLTYCDVVLAGTPNNKRIKDRELEHSWIQFHYKRANLRPSLAAANRSKGADDYATPVERIGSFKAKDEDEMSLDW
jgi:hypothetical protein